MTKEEIYQAALGTSAGEQAKFKTFLHAFRQAEGLLHICSRPSRDCMGGGQSTQSA